MRRTSRVRRSVAATIGPGRQVRRDQMASFLVRGYEVINAQELERQPTAFTDVARNTHLAAIEKAAPRGGSSWKR